MSVLLDGTTNGFATDGTNSADFKFTAGNPWSIAFWLKTSVTTNQAIGGNVSGTNGYNLYVSDDYAHKVEFEGASGTPPSAPANGDDGSWHSIVIINDGTTTTIYQDNSAGTGQTGTTTTGVNNVFTIGSQTSGGALYFTGTMAKWAVYNNYAFTSGDRLSYYTSGGVTIPSSAQANYLFANGSLNTDSSGNSHTLTPHGTGAGWTYTSDEPPSSGSSPSSSASASISPSPSSSQSPSSSVSSSVSSSISKSPSSSQSPSASISLSISLSPSASPSATPSASVSPSPSSSVSRSPSASQSPSSSISASPSPSAPAWAQSARHQATYAQSSRHPATFTATSRNPATWTNRTTS